MIKNIFILIVLVLYSGCSIKRDVIPVKELKSNEICIIEDKAVKEGFVKAYKRALEEMGYEVTILPSSETIASCSIVSTYLGRWSWDLAIYLSKVDINVFQNTKKVGSVTYDSTLGGLNFNKFVNGSDLITSLVRELFSGTVLPQNNE
jgi:hypothetical protein